NSRCVRDQRQGDRERAWTWRRDGNAERRRDGQRVDGRKRRLRLRGRARGRERRVGGVEGELLFRAAEPVVQQHRLEPDGDLRRDVAGGRRLQFLRLQRERE